MTLWTARSADTSALHVINVGHVGAPDVWPGVVGGGHVVGHPFKAPGVAGTNVCERDFGARGIAKPP